MKLLEQFRQDCRRHYRREPGAKYQNSRAHVYAVLRQRHPSDGGLYRHWKQLNAILDRVEQEERTHQPRLPMGVPGCPTP